VRIVGVLADDQKDMTEPWDALVAAGHRRRGGQERDGEGPGQGDSDSGRAPTRLRLAINATLSVTESHSKPCQDEPTKQVGSSQANAARC
jgi:hypothetical protein